MRLSLRNKKRQDLLLTGFNVRAALFFFFNLSYLTLFLFWRWCNTWSHAGFANAKDTSEAFLLADMLYCAWKLLIRRHTRTRLFFFSPLQRHCAFFTVSNTPVTCRFRLPAWHPGKNSAATLLRRESTPSTWVAQTGVKCCVSCREERYPDHLCFLHFFPVCFSSVFCWADRL